MFKADGPSIHSSMLTPLIILVVAYHAYFAMIVLWRMRTEIAERKIRALQMAQAAGSND